MSTRHQCVALIKIIRYFTYRQVDERNYIELQELIAILSDPFEKLRGGSPDPADIQQSIKLIWSAFEPTLHYPSDVDPRTITSLATLMDEGRKKDEENAHNRSFFTFIKTPGADTEQVEFILHEVGGRKQLWVRHIHIDSDFVDWILGINKDSGKPRIALFDNVHFYVGLRRTLNEAEKVGLVSDGKFCAKRTVSSFQDIQQSHNNFNGRVYALVDRNPRVHILFLIDTQLLAVFSLAMLINQKSGRKAVVMKGIDGSLYHSQHLAEELTFGKTILQFQAVYWIDAEMNKIPIEIPFESGDWPDVLSQICAKIVEASKEDRSASWLIELYMCPVAPCTQPALTEFKAWTKFLGQQTNPLVQAVVHGAEQTMV